MTRRSITAVLTSLLVGVFIAVNAPAVSADPACEMGVYDHCGRIATGKSDVPFSARAVASPAQATEPRATYRVADSSYYVPAPDGMWAVLHVQSDGAPVVEDYVSGPPPANGIALDTVLEQPVPAVTVSCADEMICPWLYSH